MKPEDDKAIPGDPSQVSGGDCSVPSDLGGPLIDAYELAITTTTDVIETIASNL